MLKQYLSLIILSTALSFTLVSGCAKEKVSIKSETVVDVLERVQEKNENVKTSYAENNFDIHIFTNEDMENKTVPCYFWTVKNHENEVVK